MIKWRVCIVCKKTKLSSNFNYCVRTKSPYDWCKACGDPNRPPLSIDFNPHGYEWRKPKTDMSILGK